MNHKFIATTVTGRNRENHSKCIYPSFQSASYTDESVPKFQSRASKQTSQEYSADSNDGGDSDFYCLFEPRPLIQNYLDDLIRYLGLSSISRLEQRNLATRHTNISDHRTW